MNDRSSANELVLLPVLKAHKSERNGRLVVTQKYLDGAAEYAKAWPGPVVSLFEVSPTPSSDMDHVEVGAPDGAHRVEVRPSDPRALAERLGTAALALGYLSPFEVETTELCNRIGVPVVHVSEYTLKTDWQIIDAGQANPVVKLRRKLWAWQAERARRRLIGISASLQCNGTPTYDGYRDLCPEALLFFDNRVREADVISPEELARKADQLRTGAPLRLVFGGRFVPMKGILHLPEVARELRQLDVPFEFSIHGAGPEEGRLRRAIARYGLEGSVKIHPPTDFRTGWVPFLKREPDLFVCCHPQGDPSSTYSEVMACGLPIAGYDNEAFTGFAGLSKGGFLAPMHDARVLARTIADLHADRSRIVVAAQRGRDYAKAHSFEATFARRTEHLIRHSRLPGR